MAELIEDDFDNKQNNSDSIVAYQYTDLQQTARAILAKATETANNKIERAKKNISELEEKVRQQGYDKGFAQGLEEGKVEGKSVGEKAAKAEFEAKVGGLNGALQNILGELNFRKQTLQAQAEVDLLALSLEIAKKVVRREVEIDERFVVPIVMEAIALTNNKNDLIIKVNPEDHSAIEEEIPTLEAIFSDIGRVSISDDDSIQKGGVKVVSRDGEVDLSLEEQFAALEKALIGDTEGMTEWDSKVKTPMPGSEEDVQTVEQAKQESIGKIVATPEDAAEKVSEDAPVKPETEVESKGAPADNDESTSNPISKPNESDGTNDTGVQEISENMELGVQSTLSGVSDLSSLTLGNDEEAIIKEIIESNVGEQDG